MKKYFQFKKEERAVLAIDILMITVALTTGLLKQKFVKAEAYVPLGEERQSTNAIAAKRETFIIEQNVKLSQKTETYINADSDVLKEVKLDLSAVDVITPGTYQTAASLRKERVSFAIKVAENAKPVIQAAHADFQFVIESNFTTQEVCDYTGVTAANASGNDLSALITGWGEELPVRTKTITCQLSVKDVQGQRVEESMRVQYLLPREDKKDQCREIYLRMRMSGCGAIVSSITYASYPYLSDISISYNFHFY